MSNFYWLMLSWVTASLVSAIIHQRRIFKNMKEQLGDLFDRAYPVVCLLYLALFMIVGVPMLLTWIGFRIYEPFAHPSEFTEEKP